MPMTLHLEILTPERPFFAGPVEEIILPAPDGLCGVLPRHEPAVIAIQAGELRFRVDGVWQYAAIGDGFVEVLPDHAVLLVASAERPEEIDMNRARLARERAEEGLRLRKSLEEYSHSQAALGRALARLKAGRAHK